MSQMQPGSAAHLFCACLLASIAGYGPCLAATLHLHKHKARKRLRLALSMLTMHARLLMCAASQLLARDTPGKVGGPPGNAFELVYGGVTDAVRRKMHAVDPVLGEYIRCVSEACISPVG